MRRHSPYPGDEEAGKAASGGMVLRVLVVEDSPQDAELMIRSLQRSGFAPKWERVDNEAQFAGRLSPDWDLILSDYRMPTFSALRALEMLQRSGLAIPFILVSGTIGEETAVEAMRNGAADYLMKDRLARLGPAVEHALEKERLRRERKRDERALRESERMARGVLDALPAHIAVVDAEGCIVAVNCRWRETAADRRLPLVTGEEGAVCFCAGPAAMTMSDSNLVAITAGIRQVVRGESPSFHAEYGTLESGDQRWFAVSAMAFTGEEPRRTVIYHEDVTAETITSANLRESERREKDRVAELRTILDAVPAAIFLAHDPGCLHMEGNLAANRLLRLAAGDECSLSAPVGQRPTHFRVAKGGRELRVDELPAQLAAQGRVISDFEFSFVFDDGDAREVVACATPLWAEDGHPRGAVTVLMDMTERKRLEREILEIGAREQQRIGQELHDDICQWLSGSECLASTLAKDLAGEFPGAAEQAGKIAQAMREALGRARALAHGLVPPMVEGAGLAPALRQLAVNSGEMFRIGCFYEGPENAKAPDEMAALHLYRIAQESISNAVKHGGASEVQIVIQPGEHCRTMLIRDNGRGLPAISRPAPGIGLRTMLYRAGLIGATLEIRPGKAGGAEVVCTFPSDS